MRNDSSGYVRFLDFMLGGAEATKQDLRKRFQVSRGTLNGWFRRARASGAPIVWERRGTRFVHRLASDYPQARTYFRHCDSTITGIIRNKRQVIRGLLEKGVPPTDREVLTERGKAYESMEATLIGLD